MNAIAAENIDIKITIKIGGDDSYIQWIEKTVEREIELI